MRIESPDTWTDRADQDFQKAAKIRRMSWRVCVELVLPLMVVVMVAVVSPASVKRVYTKDSFPEEGDATCEPKYRSLTPTHTRCAEAFLGASLHPLSQMMKEDIVGYHNELRANVDPPAANMMKMVWDDTLANSAEKLVMQCNGKHDDIKQRKEPDWPLVDIGQNLGLGHKTFRVMIDRFYTEKDRKNYQYGQKYVNGIGHFLQIVAYESTRIGCAEAHCPNLKSKVFRACNYAPALNTAEPPYKAGKWCSECPDHCDSQGRLCDCRGKLCYNGGEIDPKTCQCTCPDLWMGENCEKLNCHRPDPNACRLHSASECGKKNTLTADPNMCPHLCGVCSDLCGGLRCQNGGWLDPDSCTCKCLGLYTGPTCEHCPPEDTDYCTYYLPKHHCGTKVSEKHCPIYCGTCKTHCAPCENFGQLDPTNCKCTCKGHFSGDRCEICPKADEAVCQGLPLDYCTSEVSGQASLMNTLCPYRCGVCSHADKDKDLPVQLTVPEQVRFPPYQSKAGMKDHEYEIVLEK